MAQLIGEFESMLQREVWPSRSGIPSSKFHNPFILGLAFPIRSSCSKIKPASEETTIRGGNGESIVDFLMAQRFTGNLALIEIKAPIYCAGGIQAYRVTCHGPTGI